MRVSLDIQGCGPTDVALFFSPLQDTSARLFEEHKAGSNECDD